MSFMMVFFNADRTIPTPDDVSKYGSVHPATLNKKADGYMHRFGTTFEVPWCKISVVYVNDKAVDHDDVIVVSKLPEDAADEKKKISYYSDIFMVISSIYEMTPNIPDGHKLEFNPYNLEGKTQLAIVKGLGKYMKAQFEDVFNDELTRTYH